MQDLCGGGHGHTMQGCHGAYPQGLHGEHPEGAGQEESQPTILHLGHFPPHHSLVS